MKTFTEFVSDSLTEGHTNILFESGMYSLGEDLERILNVFGEASIPFEIVGGTAVLAHILAAEKGRRSFLTKDIDLLMHRNNLVALLAAAEKAGYEGKRIIGGYALVLPEQDLGEAVHIIFVGEKPNSAYPVVNPPLEPETKQLFGLRIPVAPVKDLLTLKLNSKRAKDQVHIELLDRAGLITPEIETHLHPELRSRLIEIRAGYEDR